MSHPFMSRRALRWLPAVIAPVLVAGIAIAAPMSAGASPTLPGKTPQQILELVAKSNSISGLSGTVQQTSDLGLPQLPTTGVGADSEITTVLGLLTGTHTAEVFESGSSDRRVKVLDSMGERDVVQHGTSVWTYDSATNAATHLTLASGPVLKRPLGIDKQGAPTTVTPADAAAMLLKKVNATTTVTPDANVTVAGRSAYGLVLAPRATGSLVGSITIAVDSATGLPLQVQVFAKGQSTPAFSTKFTQVTLAKPAASTFVFTPPTGATVKQITAPKTVYSGSYKPLTKKPMHMRSYPFTGGKPTVSGTGWSSIVTIAAADVPKTLTSSPLYKQATTAVPDGRVISTSLLNVLVTNDGRVLVGSVPVSALEAAAR